MGELQKFCFLTTLHSALWIGFSSHCGPQTGQPHWEHLGKERLQVKSYICCDTKLSKKLTWAQIGRQAYGNQGRQEPCTGVDQL